MARDHDVSVDELLQAATEAETVGDSAVALVQSLRDQIAAYTSGQQISPATQQGINAIFDKVLSERGKLEQAITANTDTGGGGDTGGGTGGGGDTGGGTPTP